MPGIARKGDTDNFGHAIANGCSDTVKVDGQPVAVQGATMDDGVAITGGCDESVKINGIPVVIKGSTTEKHTQNPGKNQVGTITNVATDVGTGG